jgi:hypothetical protein
MTLEEALAVKAGDALMYAPEALPGYLKGSLWIHLVLSTSPDNQMYYTLLLSSPNVHVEMWDDLVHRSDVLGCEDWILIPCSDSAG